MNVFTQPLCQDVTQDQFFSEYSWFEISFSFSTVYLTQTKEPSLYYNLPIAREEGRGRWIHAFPKGINAREKPMASHPGFEPGLVWFVGFYGISTFVGYLTPNPFLCK